VGLKHELKKFIIQTSSFLKAVFFHHHTEKHCKWQQISQRQQHRCEGDIST